MALRFARLKFQCYLQDSASKIFFTFFVIILILIKVFLHSYSIKMSINVNVKIIIVKYLNILFQAIIGHHSQQFQLGKFLPLYLFRPMASITSDSINLKLSNVDPNCEIILVTEWGQEDVN